MALFMTPASGVTTVNAAVEPEQITVSSEEGTAIADKADGPNLSDKEEQPDVNSINPVVINETNFPDPVFRSIISGPDYDRDGNGILSSYEIGITLNIYCEGAGVTNLKGIELFPDLQGLWCKENNISYLDVSNNKDLRGLWCSDNPLTKLDLTHNSELVWVYCYNCNLTELDVTKNPKMAFIECNSNPIKELNLTLCPELEHLTCGDCLLTELNIKNNPKLAHVDAFSNKLTSLDLSNNPKMKRLDIWDNRGLKNVDISCCPGLQYYNCAYNNVTKLDLSHNPELNKLNCAYNSISKLDLSKNPKLVYLDCACNNISNLDLSNNTYLYFLQAFTNPFTKLDIGYNPFLIQTYKEGVKAAEYDVCQGHSWTIDYGGDVSTSGDNIYFLCFDDKVSLSASPKYSKLTRIPGHFQSGTTTNDLISREAVVYILYKMAGSPSVSGLKSRFTDVQSGAWYENALLWGEKNSICMGYPYVSSKTFGVGEWIEREDLIFMLMRYAECTGYKRSIDFGRADDYMDYYDVDYYAWEAVTWAATYEMPIAKGKTNAPKEECKIDPHGFATQADFKNMFKDMLDNNKASALASKFDSLCTISAPEIKIQPASTSVIRGENAVFSVKAKGNNLSYMWQISTDGGKTWKASTASGHNTSSITMKATEALHGKYYRCIVYNYGGAAKTTAARLNTLSLLSAQPKNTRTAVGKRVTFTVTGRTSGLSYQWQVSKDLGKTWSDLKITGSTSDSITVRVTDSNVGYRFRCKVSSKNYTDYSNIVRFLFDPHIIKQPVNIKAKEGTIVKFYCKALGVTPKYQWQVMTNSGKWVDSTSAGNDTSIVRFTAAESKSGRKFRCKITDGSTIIYSDTVTFTYIK